MPQYRGGGTIWSAAAAVSADSVRAGELLALGRAGQRGRGRVRADRRRDEVEVAGADLTLVPRRGVAGCLGSELGVLQFDVGRHAADGIATGEGEHRLVECVEAREGDELELVPHRPELPLER